MKPAELSDSCRPLQMIHGFDQWPDATDEGMRERILALKQAGLGGLVINVSFKNYLRDEAAWGQFKRGVLIAHQEGMRLWIYDERPRLSENPALACAFAGRISGPHGLRSPASSRKSFQ